jgi:pimeloyl-ACP methyl ester carboxylesterase
MERSGVLERAGNGLAWRLLPGRGPTVVFLPGFMSDMAGAKAEMLAGFCAARGQAFLRFDYAGHGSSGGRFQDGTIGAWTEDALALIDALTEGPLVLVGSSMGGWIALLAGLARPERLAALVGIAAAPDFTETLMWQAMTPAERNRLQSEGALHFPSQYGEPYPVTRALIEEGRNHLLLDAPVPLACPVRLLHGQRDAEVPWETSLRLAAALNGEDVRVSLVKDGEHRLSRPQDLALLGEVLAPLLVAGRTIGSLQAPSPRPRLRRPRRAARGTPPG